MRKGTREFTTCARVARVAVGKQWGKGGEVVGIARGKAKARSLAYDSGLVTRAFLTFRRSIQQAALSMRETTGLGALMFSDSAESQI